LFALGHHASRQTTLPDLQVGYSGRRSYGWQGNMSPTF